MSPRLKQIGGDMTAQPLTLFDLSVDLDPPAALPKETVEPRSVPASIDLMSAARLLGIGRTCAYGLVRTGRWPTPVIRVGRCIRIPTRPLLALLDPDLADIHRPPSSSVGDGAGVRD
jgi:hypothetical protein